MSKLRDSVSAIALAVIIIAPALAGAAIAVKKSAESPLESATKVEPLMGVIESSERSGTVNVGLTVEFVDAYVPTTNANGVVTSINIEPGSTVQTGTVLLTVGGANVIAYVSDTPLYRDIWRGLSGPDVAVAQHLLTALGYDTVTQDGKAGNTTDRAIKAFNEANGYGKNNGNLSLASLVWVGQHDIAVAEVLIKVGTSVSPGTEVFNTSASISGIAVAEPASINRQDSLVLVVGDIVTPYQPNSLSISDAEVASQIAAFMHPQTQSTGVLRLEEPQLVATIPSSAVVSMATGETCFFASATAAPTAVNPLGGTLGVIDVDQSLAGQAVLVNPREVLQDPSCN